MSSVVKRKLKKGIGSYYLFLKKKRIIYPEVHKSTVQQKTFYKLENNFLLSPLLSLARLLTSFPTTYSFIFLYLFLPNKKPYSLLIDFYTAWTFDCITSYVRSWIRLYRFNENVHVLFTWTNYRSIFHQCNFDNICLMLYSHNELIGNGSYISIPHLPAASIIQEISTGTLFILTNSFSYVWNQFHSHSELPSHLRR